MPEVVAEGKCFGDWILLPLLCRPEAAPLRELPGWMQMSCIQEIPARGKYFCMTATISLKRPGKAGRKLKNKTETGTFDPSVMLFQYPYQRETLLPAQADGPPS